ncbi:MAG TPA: hypothetical protein VE152_12250 [Acidimicrobiales bacterium]|nr:hypothetical protein [Acidimicrobiales bacterium]
MARGRTSPWGPPQPLPPRRRYWLLVVVTLVALVPAAIGFGVSQLTGGHPTPARPASPPKVTLAATSGQATAVLVSWCWSRRGPCRPATSPARPSPPVLGVPSGATVGIQFAIAAQPSSVTIAPAGGGPPRRLPIANPTSFKVTPGRGRRTLVLATRWPEGRASYLVHLDVG